MPNKIKEKTMEYQKYLRLREKVKNGEIVVGNDEMETTLLNTTDISELIKIISPSNAEGIRIVSSLYGIKATTLYKWLSKETKPVPYFLDFFIFAIMGDFLNNGEFQKSLKTTITFKEVLALSKLSMPKFSKAYNIPLIVLKSWSDGERNIKDYLLCMIYFAVSSDTKTELLETPSIVTPKMFYASEDVISNCKADIKEFGADKTAYAVCKKIKGHRFCINYLICDDTGVPAPREEELEGGVAVLTTLQNILRVLNEQNGILL